MSTDNDRLILAIKGITPTPNEHVRIVVKFAFPEDDFVPKGISRRPDETELEMGLREVRGLSGTAVVTLGEGHRKSRGKIDGDVHDVDAHHLLEIFEDAGYVLSDAWCQLRINQKHRVAPGKERGKYWSLSFEFWASHTPEAQKALLESRGDWGGSGEAMRKALQGMLDGHIVCLKGIYENPLQVQAWRGLGYHEIVVDLKDLKLRYDHNGVCLHQPKVVAATWSRCLGFKRVV